MADLELVGLIGWPVEHSVSPAMQNAAFEALGLPWRYQLLPTPPGEVGAALARLRAEGYRGANVTVPHKQAVMPFLDEIGAAARAIGAVNTLVLREGRWEGHNTDAQGFLAALRAGGCQPEGQRVLVLGAGGGARSVVYALTQVGCEVTIYNRTASRARALAADMAGLGRSVSAVATLDELDLGTFGLLVNATSVGMWPDVDASPWPAALPLPGQWTVFDLVYNPAETRLLAQARAAGATTIGGLGMLVYQGALAFELWTGYRPPVALMRAAAERALRGSLSPAAK